MKISLPLGIVISLRCLYPAILVLAAGSVSATCALAETIAVDVQGHIVINGSPGTMGTLGTDPDTGLPVLIYSLPFQGTPGEVLLTNPGATTEFDNKIVSDVIRFPGNGTLEYYSDLTKQTTSSATINVGDTNIKITATKGYSVGEQIQIDDGANAEMATIVAVGTPGATGTGITIATPLTEAHMSGVFISRPIGLADVLPFPLPLDDAIVSLLGVAGGTVWSPGTGDVGGDASSPEYIFGVAATPLPCTLPLFATGLGGLGLLGWRRKRRAQAT